ncbi:MAG: hypothetical protein KJO79_10705 [Verrucomicrobiae bacterium]|nr:hypothetical protein [Verrucomicrobiae bacterium]NNJ87644.1 hypothetical protein [Akkermansiaceae bacterium]
MIRLESLGVHLPDRVVSTREITDSLGAGNEIPLAELTGIKERRYASEEQSSVDLAILAAQSCLTNSSYQPGDLDVVIFTGISTYTKSILQQPIRPSHQIFPSLSFSILERIGATNADNFDICNACAGMSTGIKTLTMMINTGVCKNGMVVSGELISYVTEAALKVVKGTDDPEFSSLTLGDSGAAVILDKGPLKDQTTIEQTRLEIFPEYADLCVAKSTDQGTHMHTDSSRLYKAGIKHSYDVLKKLSLRNIKHYIPHQISVMAVKIGYKYSNRHELMDHYMPYQRFSKSVQHYGNTATTSHWLALADLLRQGELSSGDRVLFMIQASGLIVGGFVVKIGKEAPQWVL